MQPIEFKGADKLIALMDSAVAAGKPEAVTETIKHDLCRLINQQEVRLPIKLSRPCAEHYARRLLYRSEEYDYTVVAMTWGPGQGTPLHDHAGLWCVEGVWQGQLEVEQYELLERSDARFRFKRCETMHASVGTAGCLIPPHEFHRIYNPTARSAVSVHIYSSDMLSCHTFEPAEGQWYTEETHPLSYDNATIA
jgi:predicted metal-dependent enzyme (double-stranded beta helix superfamily)